MKKILISAMVVLGLGLAGGSAYLYYKPDTKKSDQNTSQQTAQKPAPTITISEDGKTVSYDGKEGESALTTLESLTSVKTKSSSFGKFVTTINGLEADSKKEYWSFYINDKVATEGAETYKAKLGDKFKWRLEQLISNE